MISIVRTVLIGSLLLANSQAATLALQSFDPSDPLQVTIDPGMREIQETPVTGFTVVVFTEKGGYGCFPTVVLDAFAWQSLNIVFEGGDAAEIKAPPIDESLETYQPGAVPIPEVDVSLIGGVGLLLLLRRRR